MVKRSPCKDQICRLDIELLASEETMLTVLGTKLDKAIPPALLTLMKENSELFSERVRSRQIISSQSRRTKLQGLLGRRQEK